MATDVAKSSIAGAREDLAAEAAEKLQLLRRGGLQLLLGNVMGRHEARGYAGGTCLFSRPNGGELVAGVSGGGPGAVRARETHRWEASRAATDGGNRSGYVGSDAGTAMEVMGQ